MDKVTATRSVFPRRGALEKPPNLSKPASPKTNWIGWISVVFLSSSILAVFITRTILARAGSPPRLFEIFNTLILVLASVVLATGFRHLQRLDWTIALGVAALLGVLLSLSSFYPLVSLKHPALTSLAHAGSLAIIFLAGLVVMRQGGPVKVKVVNGNWSGALKSAGAGIIFGLPLAALNTFAFSVMDARPIAWRNPALAGIDALQPGVVEEVIYRLAFLGFIWFFLRQSLAGQGGTPSGNFEPYRPQLCPLRPALSGPTAVRPGIWRRSRLVVWAANDLPGRPPGPGNSDRFSLDHRLVSLCRWILTLLPAQLTRVKTPLPESS